MKFNILYALSLSLLLHVSCESEDIASTSCEIPATVRDLTGLDGCGFVFELEDGRRLEPQHGLAYCGTPPLPKEVTENPLYGFDWADGKKVKIGYKKCTDCGSYCMTGQVVKITCIVVDTVSEDGL
jgi:hypothetical protein